MSLQATCDSCGKTYSLNEKYAGKRLPCKECGELFEVQGDEEDFELAPSRPRRAASGRPRRGAPPVRSPKKKSGKKRRKSGPNGLLIGLGIGGGLLVLGGLVWAVIMLIPHTHDSLAKAHLKAMNKMADILEGVTDKASAEAAVPKLEKLTDHMAELYREGRQLKETDPMTMEKNDALWEKYGPDREEVQERLDAQRKRLQQIPGVLAILQEPLTGISRKIAEVREEERERKWAERGMKPPGSQQSSEEWFKEAEKRHKEAHQKAVEAARARSEVARQTTDQASQDAPGLTVKLFTKTPNFDAICQRLQEMAGGPQLFGASNTSDGHTVNIAPVPDLQRFVEAVDFGQVLEVDQAQRIITIDPFPTYTFDPGGRVAVDKP